MSKPIVVEVTKATEAFPKGAILGYESEAQASKILGDGAFKVTGHQDGTAMEAPARPKRRRKKKADAKADKEVPRQSEKNADAKADKDQT